MLICWRANSFFRVDDEIFQWVAFFKNFPKISKIYMFFFLISLYLYSSIFFQIRKLLKCLQFQELANLNIFFFLYLPLWTWVFAQQSCWFYWTNFCISWVGRGFVLLGGLVFVCIGTPLDPEHNKTQSDAHARTIFQECRIFLNSWEITVSSALLLKSRWILGLKSCCSCYLNCCCCCCHFLLFSSLFFGLWFSQLYCLWFTVKQLMTNTQEYMEREHAHTM